ncbi:glutathione S-transferase-like [Bradysia coprophila]|uniref:glutathione S-transferase-like n=1 Tax=Bradysia coprophila TaxID=38358 RepID=UPI00187D7367|nr:glutathione S-transferase-like [Bradysia coprophila]
MSPTYKLYYFNIRALAEPIRYALAYGGITYEDVRVEREDWPKLKPTMPMGQMPVLEVDGKRVHQSIAILRYVAKIVGLAGADDWENLQIDSAVDTINDLRQKMAAVHFEADEAVKLKKRETLLNETVPFYLGKLEELAVNNNGHLAASKLTWADLFFASLLELFKIWTGPDVLAKYPNLAKTAENVYNLDSIKDWIKRRPVTEM